MANDPSRSRHSHDNAYDDGYEQSYGKDDLHDPRAQQCKCDTDELEREYRKSQLLDEFQQERDLIIVSIQSALKTNQYGDAYALVERYRTVARLDREFQILARMTDKGMSVNDFIIQLDATPDKAYAKRIALCEKILEINPELEEYQKELERCRHLRGPVTDTQPASHSLPQPATNVIHHYHHPPALTCPRCGNHSIRVVERTKLTGSGIVWLIILLIFFFPLFFIPLLACRRTYFEHYCQNCRRGVAQY